MDYVFPLYLKRPVRYIPVYIPIQPKRKLIYKSNHVKNVEDYESGFSFPATKRLVYVNKTVDDDLEF